MISLRRPGPLRVLPMTRPSSCLLVGYWASWWRVSQIHATLISHRIVALSCVQSSSSSRRSRASVLLLSHSLSRSDKSNSALGSWHNYLVNGMNITLLSPLLHHQMAPKKVTKQLETPQKNKIHSAAEFCERKGIKFTKIKLAKAFLVSRD